MNSLSLASLLMIPALCAVVSSVLGIALAYGRTLGRSAAWIVFDVLVLLPAFLPAHPLASVLKGIFGEPPGPIDEFWPIFAIILIATPFAYLPARIAFARISRESRPHLADILLAWPFLVLSALLATARMLGEMAGEIFADGPILVMVIVPTLVAAILIARSAARQAT